MARTKGMHRLGERALVDRARDGDREAAGALFERHWPRAWRIAFAITGNRAHADDAAQVALIRALSALERFDSSRPFRPWLDRIATRAAIDQLRRSGPVPVENVPEWADPSVDARDGTDLADSLMAGVMQLAPDRRVVVVLRYWVDLSVEEIADVLGTPPGTVASRLSRALAELRKRIEVPGHERHAL